MLDTSLTHTFSFDNDIPMVYVALQVIGTNIFEDILILVSRFPQSSVTVQNWMEFYNIIGYIEYDDPCDIYIPKF